MRLYTTTTTAPTATHQQWGKWRSNYSVCTCVCASSLKPPNSSSFWLTNKRLVDRENGWLPSTTHSSAVGYTIFSSFKRLKKKIIWSVVQETNRDKRVCIQGITHASEWQRQAGKSPGQLLIDEMCGLGKIYWADRYGATRGLSIEVARVQTPCAFDWKTRCSHHGQDSSYTALSHTR